MALYVQFKDDSLTDILAVLGGPQDPANCPHQATLEDDDPRYLAFINARVIGKIKGRRFDLLSSCDWTDLPNCPLSTAKKAEWAAYRQALRDITNQTGFPSTIVWPTQPT